MSTETTQEWLFPAAIPFEDLKAKDLEECVYWFLDAMGAKDLEWRTGGTGAGAADGGRDLEAHFFVPDETGEISSQTWWVECKGRKGTVEASEVKSAVNNALAYEGLDRLVIASNTQFSNPTIDWVKDWQKKFPKPIIDLWDKAHLERYLSRHPEVVLRLFSEALSMDGRLQALDSRFWNKFEFVNARTLSDIWKAKDDLKISHSGLFALIANEFANGEITHRPWGACFDTKSVIEVLFFGLQNMPYMLFRSTKAGIDQTILARAFAYLILVALDAIPAETVAEIIEQSLSRDGEVSFPDDVYELLLMPIADQLLSEMQDVCSEDCRRLHSLIRSTLTEDKDEIDTYWLRLESAGIDEPEERRSVRLESYKEPCEVGYAVDEENSCPLFEFEPTTKNTKELLELIKRVAAFRKAQVAAKRKEETSD